jgi:hypothetical protein
MQNPIIIQFNSYLFTCKLNSPEANYKVSTSNKKKTKYNKKVYTLMIVIAVIIIIEIIIIIIVIINNRFNTLH